MAVVLRRFFNGYSWLINDLSDPRANDYFLMSSPISLLPLLYLYVKFIYDWGPKFMEKRKPYGLRRTIIAYNAIQIVCNFILSCLGISIALNMNWRCSLVDYSENGRTTLTLTYCYFLLKISDLADTVFFVLKKKYNHTSFLHVYHHFLMVPSGWIGVKYWGGGHTVFLGVLNVIVHTLMYTYYLLTALDDKHKRNIRLKKSITQVQIIQFLILLFMYGQLFFRKDCMYPKIVAYLFVPQCLFMVVLFVDFYVKQYWRKKQ